MSRIRPKVDLAILGGGINGAGVAFQAAQAAFPSPFSRMGDFRLRHLQQIHQIIHGGIRYLEQFRFSLVLNPYSERHRLLQTAPHLVRPLSFLLPCYAGDESPLEIKDRMWLYDLLAGSRPDGLPPMAFRQKVATGNRPPQNRGPPRLRGLLRRPGQRCPAGAGKYPGGGGIKAPSVAIIAPLPTLSAIRKRVQ